MADVAEHPLITKYRPQAFDEVIGHTSVLAALQRAIAGPSHPHFYLLTGPSGVGKTTVARIIADFFECEVNAVDAASESGVDDTRELVELGQHRSIMGTGNRMFIIDEAHNLSRKGWEPLLALTEEPPQHLYVAVCTTEARKIPKTIVTRAYKIELSPLSRPQMSDLLDVVAEGEGWVVPDEVINAVLGAAEGSPRLGIAMLQAVHGCKDREECSRVISLIASDDEPVRRLCQTLMHPKECTWANVQRILKEIPPDVFEQAALLLGGYMANVVLAATNQEAVRRANDILQAFTYPTASYDPKVNFVAAIGRIMWSN